MHACVDHTHPVCVDIYSVTSSLLSCACFFETVFHIRMYVMMTVHVLHVHMDVTCDCDEQEEEGPEGRHTGDILVPLRFCELKSFSENNPNTFTKLLFSSESRLLLPLRCCELGKAHTTA